MQGLNLYEMSKSIFLEKIRKYIDVFLFFQENRI